MSQVSARLKSISDQRSPRSSLLAASLHLGDDATRKVILVPAGLDQDHPSARPESGQQVRFVPIPYLLARALGIGVLARADGSSINAPSARKPAMAVPTPAA
jgi:hypothetical protein